MIRRLPLLATAVLFSLALGACAGTTPRESASLAAGTEDPTAEPTPEEAAPGASQPATGSPSPSGAACPATTDNEDETCQIVLAKANIFGGGRDEPLAPSDGGAGIPPPMWAIPVGATSMIVASTAGLVRSTPYAGWNGAGGDLYGPTDVSSFNGISGIVHRENGMFLVGVFLTDEVPREGEGPERLGFTGNEDFEELAPEIGQTFFIGDGIGRTYVVPTGATRLFLGFVDAFAYRGQPSWYGNNSGELAVSVAFASE